MNPITYADAIKRFSPTDRNAEGVPVTLFNRAASRVRELEIERDPSVKRFEWEEAFVPNREWSFDLIKYKAAGRQTCLVRDTAADVFGRNYEEYEQYLGAEPEHRRVLVVGSHTSKSRPLPVFFVSHIRLPIAVFLSNNYHQWSVTLLSDQPFEKRLAEFVKSFARSKSNDYNFYGYGFEEEWKVPHTDRSASFDLSPTDLMLHLLFWEINGGKFVRDKK